MFYHSIMTRDQITKKFRPNRDDIPPVALTVLEEIDGDVTKVEDDIVDFIYDNLRGGPTNSKRTARGRYFSVDDIVIEEMTRLFPEDQFVRVHDMAASSGITSLEFYELMHRWKYVRFLASDYYDTAFVVSIPDDHWRVVFDGEERPVQFIGKNIVVYAMGPQRRRYVVNRLLLPGWNHACSPRPLDC